MVPCGLSPCSSPAFDIIDGLSSAPPIHQSPCCLAGCPRFRAVGLSPYVGWLLKAVPVFSQPWSPFSKSNLHASVKKYGGKLKLFQIILFSITKTLDGDEGAF